MWFSRSIEEVLCEFTVAPLQGLTEKEASAIFSDLQTPLFDRANIAFMSTPIPEGLVAVVAVVISIGVTNMSKKMPSLKSCLPLKRWVWLTLSVPTKTGTLDC
jgi:hypothetical protein